MTALKEQTEKIKEWFKVCDTRKEHHRKALERALMILWARQTDTERAIHETKVTNGVGLNGHDAPIVGNYVTSLRQFGRISNQAAIDLKFRLKKYAKQLAENKLQG